MTEHTFSNESPSGQVLTIGDASVTPGSKLASQRFAADLTSIGVAIAFAGAAYPIVLAIGSTIVFALSETSEIALNEIAGGLAMIFVYVFVGAVIGLFWAGFVAFATLPLVYFFVRSFGLQASLIPFGAFCGGLVGFVAVVPFFIGFMSGSPGPLEMAGMAAIGPALTTVIGQLGGAWGGSRVRWYERAVAQAAIVEGRGLQNEPTRSSNGNVSPPRHRVQFGVRHLMVVCIWVALLLTAIRLSGFDYLLVLLLLFGWLVYQAATLWIGGRLMSWYGLRKARRQSRST